ncbi:hypothetical protein RUM44_008327 [Polyplax serrata]|uniref:Tudor domain-containing protein n=1 Tax=Polyplax serrata TaxID=468196 RepID=A0ABR1BA13_POLSC
MSPALPVARPCWVWSLPAFAIILSLLWYRKKRGSLKTDSGGTGETSDERKSVESDVDSEVLQTSDFSGLLAKSENKSVGAVEEKVEEVKLISSLGKATVSTEGEDNGKEEAETKKTNSEVGKYESITENLDGGFDVDEVVRAIEESLLPEPKEEEEVEILAIEEKTSAKAGIKHKKMKNTAKKGKESNADMIKKDDDTACILEKKLAKLELGSPCNMVSDEDKERNDDVTERDSANNSPSEVMLASPSVSGYSDTHSEGSSDSGKGCSEMLTPSRTPASGNSVSGDLPVTSIYEFVIPQQLVGRLIGRHGSFVNEIKETTHASIYIKRHPETSKLKICAVEGTQIDIESALDMIRHKFPKKRYPSVTLEQVVIAPEPQLIPIISESMQLYLVESINNDVLLSSLVTAGHFFLQQPTHPTYLSLSRLNSCMNYCYSEPDQPTIPEGVGSGILCAAPVHNGWYRAQITSMDAENKMCDVKFVDYGGYMTMPVSMLRQIRFDFVNLPFQAAECYLASVKPANEENVWCEKAKKVVEKLTFGKVLQAQVYGYADDGVPLIYLYTVNDDKSRFDWCLIRFAQGELPAVEIECTERSEATGKSPGVVVLINEELVNLGLAEWIYTEMDEIVDCDDGIDETAPIPVPV